MSLELLGRSRDFRNKNFKKFQIIVGNEAFFSERSSLGLEGTFCLLERIPAVHLLSRPYRAPSWGGTRLPLKVKQSGREMEKMKRGR